jgi:hypothetical protein
MEEIMLFKRPNLIFLGAMLIFAFFAASNVSKADPTIKVKKVLYGDTVRLTLTHSFSAEELGLRWFKDGEEISFSGKEYRKPNANFNDDGIYYITYNLCSRVDTMYMHIIVMRDTSESNNPSVLGPTAGVDNTTDNSGFKLLNNQPNPFGDRTTISFIVPTEQKATLTIIDNIGNEVVVLFDGVAKQGLNQFDFYPSKYRLTSGTYYYILRAQNFTDSKPMVIVK